MEEELKGLKGWESWDQVISDIMEKSERESHHNRVGVPTEVCWSKPISWRKAKERVIIIASVYQQKCVGVRIFDRWSQSSYTWQKN